MHIDSVSEVSNNAGYCVVEVSYQYPSAWIPQWIWGHRWNISWHFSASITLLLIGTAFSV